MNTAKGKGANAFFLKLRQASCYEAAILLSWIGCIKEITCLNEKINSLAYGKSNRFLKGLTQALPTLLTFARMLSKCSVSEMVISGQNHCDQAISMLIGGTILLQVFSDSVFCHDALCAGLPSCFDRGAHLSYF